MSSRRAHGGEGWLPPRHIDVVFSFGGIVASSLFCVMPDSMTTLDPKLYHFSFISGAYSGDNVLPVVSCTGSQSILYLKQCVVDLMMASKAPPTPLSIKNVSLACMWCSGVGGSNASFSSAFLMR